MSNSKKLIDLFYESKKKSIKWKKYFSVYEELFQKYKGKKITFIEIGILDGGSLEIWKNYFGPKAKIIGIDKNYKCKNFENENFKIYIGSQSDPFFWNKFYNEIGKVDIILDDGGHTNDQQITSLVKSLKNINDGGLYVVEDTHTSYQKHFGNPYKYSFINFAKKCIDDLNYNFPNFEQFRYTINNIVYSAIFYESIVAFKIDRKLCKKNYKIENNGYKSNFSDVALDERFFKFRKKFRFLYKFKITSKIERLFIKIFHRKKARLLKKYFR